MEHIITEEAEFISKYPMAYWKLKRAIHIRYGGGVSYRFKRALVRQHTKNEISVDINLVTLKSNGHTRYAIGFLVKFNLDEE